MLHKLKQVSLPPSLIMQFYSHVFVGYCARICNNDDEDVEVLHSSKHVWPRPLVTQLLIQVVLVTMDRFCKFVFGH